MNNYMDSQQLLAILQQAVSDKRISWQGKGLLVYVILRQLLDGQDPGLEELVSAGPDGAHRVRSILTALEVSGWLERRKGRGDNGHFVWKNILYLPTINREK